MGVYTLLPVIAGMGVTAGLAVVAVVIFCGAWFYSGLSAPCPCPPPFPRCACLNLGGEGWVQHLPLC